MVKIEILTRVRKEDLCKCACAWRKGSRSHFWFAKSRCANGCAQAARGAVCERDGSGRWPHPGSAQSGPVGSCSCSISCLSTSGSYGFCSWCFDPSVLAARAATPVPADATKCGISAILPPHIWVIYHQHGTWAPENVCVSHWYLSR